MNTMMVQYLAVPMDPTVMQYFVFLIAALGDTMPVMLMYPYDMYP